MQGVRPRVWITRAQPGADRTAARLTALGFDPVVAPVLEIRRVVQAVPDLSDVDALVFTSINGVTAFMALIAGSDTGSAIRALPVLTVGGATARAACDAGFGAVRSAEGDLNDLAAMIREDGGSRASVLLHAAAREPAGDLAALVGDAASVRSLCVYEAVDIDGTAPAFDHVLIHSPRAARAVARRLAGKDLRGSKAVAISAAAAEPLHKLRFEAVRLAATPNELALIAALMEARGPIS